MVLELLERAIPNIITKLYERYKEYRIATVLFLSYPVLNNFFNICKNLVKNNIILNILNKR